MRKFIAGVAAIAMASSMAYAQPGNGKGQGNGKDKGQAAQVDRGPGNGKADRGGPGNGNNKMKAAKQDRGPQMDRGNNGKGNAVIADRGNGNGIGNAKVKYDRPGNGNGQGNAKAYRGNDRYDDGDYRRGGYRDRDGNIVDRVARWGDDRNYGLVDGCPPGLRKKTPACIPPGLAKKQQNGYLGSGYYRPSFFGLGGVGDGRYYYNDGYLMRMGNNNLVDAFIPLLGGALGIGKTWPSYYQPVSVPRYYQDYYGLSPNGYRYADNVLYRVDPETQAIQSIAALLTGDEFRVGQAMPQGYDVYNVPYGYRDQYYDRPDAYYRYSDGYVYQVDPETRLIAAAIELLI